MNQLSHLYRKTGKTIDLTIWTFVGKVISLLFNMLSSLSDFPGGSDGKSIWLQWGRPGFDPWVRKIPWRSQWQPTPVLLPEKIPWMEEPGRLQSMGLQRVGPDWTTSLHFTLGTSVFWFHGSVAVHTDFRTPKNKTFHPFHFFPFCFPWSDGTKCHNLSWVFFF